MLISAKKIIGMEIRRDMSSRKQCLSQQGSILQVHGKYREKGIGMQSSAFSGT